MTRNSKAKAQPTTCHRYFRISLDHAGRELGVGRQDTDTTELANRMGLTIVGEPYVDNDISAKRNSRTGKLRERPAYNRLMDDVRAGKVESIVCWDVDRLNRDQRELEDLVDALAKHQVPVYAAMGSPLDLATAGGRMVARVLGAVAVQESEHKGERVAAQKQQLREHGAWTGGPVPYGFRLARCPHDFPSLAPVEPAAGEVRGMVESVLAGVSLRRIAADLTKREVAPSRGTNGWSATMVRQVIIRPATAGLRSHEGKVVGPACWDALVDQPTWERAVAVLSAPERHTGGSKSRVWLVPDLVRNDAGERGKVEGNGSKLRYYSVPGASYRADHLDATVWKYALGVGDRGVGRPDATPEPITDEAAAIQADIDRVRTLMGAGDMDVLDGAPLLRMYRERLAEVRAAAPVTLTPTRVLDLLERPGAIRAADEANALTLTDKRTIVLGLVDHIVLRGRYAAERVVIVPRDHVR